MTALIFFVGDSHLAIAMKGILAIALQILLVKFIPIDKDKFALLSYQDAALKRGCRVSAFSSNTAARKRFQCRASAAGLPNT